MKSQDIVDHELELRAAGRYLVVADIAQCYPSIYTHSIPWAMHSKQTAKKNKRNKSYLGNRIDSLVQKSQDLQTKGIPIGPDTSFAVSEIVLTACDNEIVDQLPNSRIIRYWDEYRVACRDRSDVDRALASIQSALSSYELHLNPQKTTVVELPCTFEPPWVTELRTAFRVGQNATSESYALRRLANRALDLAREYPRDHVIPYAVAILDGHEPYPENQTLFHHLLLQLANSCPLSLSRIIMILYLLEADHGCTFDHEITATALAAIANHAALRGASSEVAACLAACKLLDVTIPSASIIDTASWDDPFTILLALSCRENNLLDGNIDTSNWKKLISSDGLDDENWLLSYEAGRRRWISTIDAAIVNHPLFGKLHSEDVFFFDTDYAPTSPEIEESPMTGFPF